MQRPSRKLVRMRVDFSSSSEDEEFTGHGYTIDLNANGCQIETATVLPPGRYLTLRFYEANTHHAVQVELARVRWAEGRHFGVEFIHRDAKTHAYFDRVSPPQLMSGPSGAVDVALTIMVVEDNPDEMLLYSKVLSSGGHKVLQAAGSIEAMKLCVTQPAIDLALVDVVLTVPVFRLQDQAAQFHRVNGPQLVRDIVAVRKRIHVLFMSSLNHAQLKDHGVVLGASSFLQKPFSKDQLLSSIATTLEQPPLVWTPPPPTKPDSIRWKD
ncbi:PilZ domain-containing protein [Nitrospira moscoviensis]|uniref:PilZ domain-containing protein n=1 Tax=Nitrospira moscoviensis TaxID=42253 RepID=UPI0009F85271|nr:PilZ domain-containing protein [Nitrospira moscoviensis]